MSLWPTIEERDPFRSHADGELQADVGDADVAFRVETVRRRIPELQAFCQVQLADERTSSVQDHPEARSDVENLQIVAVVVSSARGLQQLELLPEGFEKVLLASLDDR